jgi:hypothetical protein
LVDVGAHEQGLAVDASGIELCANDRTLRRDASLEGVVKLTAREGRHRRLR